MNGPAQERPDSGGAHGWQWNLLLFGLLVLIVLGYFFRQAEQVRTDFVRRTTDHSRMLASIISFSLANARASQESIEETIHTFLANTAKFVDYLDTIEPFSAEELTAFAKESNLAGITILEPAGEAISGPAGWASDLACQPVTNSLIHRPEQRLYLLHWPRVSEAGCLVIGFGSEEIDRLMARIGSERLTRNLAGLPLIDSVRLESGPRPDPTRGEAEVAMVRRGSATVAESRIPFGDGLLVVATDATPYVSRMATLKEEFILFALLLSGLGLFFSWILYRYQLAFLSRARAFERQIAKQHEEAALGRSAAIINHEIRNPLNAIAMGLQRLEMEVDLPPEQGQLITSMRQAVARTSQITDGLKQVTQPLTPRLQQVRPHDLITALLTLYRDPCLSQGIAVEYTPGFAGTIEADGTLLSQLLENLCKNAIEAQPGGGYIQVELGRQGQDLLLTMKNPGLTLPGATVRDILEPYYTTKTHGTGLGLAVCRRIVEAHGGTLTPSVPEAGTLLMTVRIPCHPPRGH